jgi:ATP-dependent RNA helicase DeaD
MTVENPSISPTEAESERPTFDGLPLTESLKKALKEVGYLHPTPVQQAALAPALAGTDLVVQARTGTGKTAAFALPLLNGRVNPALAATQALILAPTRELALQVKAEIERLSRHTSLRLCSVYGGAPIGRQIEELAEGAHIVVGTPGRVLDHLERRTIDLSALRAFVLDECDEMLSMGFLPQIIAIWEQLPSSHQTLLFSATISRDVLRIAETRLRQPEFITLSGDHVGALEIQHFVYLSHGDRLAELLSVIEVENPESAIVFCNTKDETKRVSRQLQVAGYSTEWLNADLSQSDREKVMAQTRAGKVRFLVCTDVAARGIDISHLTHVINFDFPESSEQYVHRTGRTGRAGKMGTAISLVGPDAIGNLYYLRLKFKIRPIERHLPSRREVQTRKEADVVGLLELKFPKLPLNDEHRSLARRLLTHDQCESIIGGLLRASLREDSEHKAAGLRKNGQPRAEASRTESPRAEASRTEVSRSELPSDASPALSARSPEPARAERAKTVARPRAEAPRRLDPADGASRRRRRPLAGEERRERDLFADREIRYQVSDAPGEGVALNDSANEGRVSESSPGESSFDVKPETANVSEAAAKTSIVNDDDAPSPNADEYVNLFVNVGRRDGATPEVLKSALEEAGVQHTSTGRIAIRERHSFVEVRPYVQQIVISKLHGITLCGRVTVVEVARPRGAN